MPPLCRCREDTDWIGNSLWCVVEGMMWSYGNLHLEDTCFQHPSPLSLFSPFPWGGLTFSDLSAGADRGQERALGILLCGRQSNRPQSMCLSFPQQRMAANCTVLERLLNPETQLNHLATLLFLLKIMACCTAWTQLERAPHHKEIVFQHKLFSWYPFHNSWMLHSQVLCIWDGCIKTLSLIVWTILLKYFLVRTFISVARYVTKTTSWKKGLLWSMALKMLVHSLCFCWFRVYNERNTPVEWACGRHYSFHVRQITERMKMLELTAFFLLSFMSSV